MSDNRDSFIDLESSKYNKRQQELRGKQLAAEQQHKEYTRVFNINAKSDRKRREAFIQHMKDNQPRSDEVGENTGKMESIQTVYPYPYRASDTPRQTKYLNPSNIDPLMILNRGNLKRPDASTIQGIGALELGEENDWDQFVPMDAGRKRKGRKGKKTQKIRKSKKAKKSKKSKKAKKSKKSKTSKK
jgi:hypothetical protein